MGEWDELRRHVGEGIPEELPLPPLFDDTVAHAPTSPSALDPLEEQLALSNALRYFPTHQHKILATEFATELRKHGRIRMLRFRPTEYAMKAHPISAYPCRSREAAAVMLMIQNNLDPNVAQYPHELITYGGNGAVFQNWAQYRLTMQYLSEMTDSQTLVMYSGHPLGLFPSHTNAPRVVITNGLMVPNYSKNDDYERGNAMGITQYGQMTAGSYMYIGPQGIVHGTTITLLNAARIYLKRSADQRLSGTTFVSSGLGGMSGAQAKAAVIAGAACIIAEIDPDAATKRYNQGWIAQITHDVDEAIDRMLQAKREAKATSIGFVGNVVDLWERLDEREIHVDLGSDQTSLHNPWKGGYYPTGVGFLEARKMIAASPEKFAKLVRASLVRHADAISRMSKRGMAFWDYGNAFLLEASRAGADVMNADGTKFSYPSYVEDIMGPMCFDHGFGPFRWICSSASESDLDTTDAIATGVLTSMAKTCSPEIKQQVLDNLLWISEAKTHKMVVGSKARILYADAEGRREIALAFNDAINDGRISAPIILGRDHHDVGGTDSPYRETANIRDGSMFTADMSVHNFVGDAFRGATWVSLHNGGGVGWGEAINGGFGMVLDGTDKCEERIQLMLGWDVNNGVARRAWARNQGALFTIQQAMLKDSELKVTLPHPADASLVESALK